MALPKELTTVTSFSKVLSAIFFVMLPILGFIIGTQYGYSLPQSGNMTMQSYQKTNNIAKPEALTKSDQERLEQYKHKISTICSGKCFLSEGVTDNHSCFAQCLGGQEQLQEYINLSEKFATEALISKKNNPLPEYPGESELNADRVGYIKKVYEKKGKKYLEIDYLQWFSDSVKEDGSSNLIDTMEGSKACMEDGKCHRDECHVDLWISCLTNSYYIRNNDPRTVTLEVAESAVIENYKNKTRITQDEPKLSEITFTELANTFNSKKPEDLVLQAAPYNLIIKNTVIVAISQKYLP